MIRAEYFMRGPRVSHSPKLIRRPDLSIILPTYCRGDSGLLKRAIDSVLSQSFSAFELIVMDDGSVDSTADLIAAYVNSDDRVIHVRHDTNCGLPALRVNEGLLIARGELCAYQFDDDQWTSNFLQVMTEELRKNPGFEVAYGRCRWTIGANHSMLGGPFDYSRLVAGNCIANNSLVHRRSIFERLGGFDMHLVMRRLCDWDLWLRWGRRVPFLFVDEVVSIVEGGKPDSVGRNCFLDLFMTRAHMAFDRDDRLRPEALKSYAVDELDHLRHLGKHKLNAIWRQHVAPYQSRFREIWTEVRMPSANRAHVLMSGTQFDGDIDMTIRNLAQNLARDFAFTFVPQQQTNEAAILCADILMLAGVIEQHTPGLAEIARRHGKTVGYLMDEEVAAADEVAKESAVGVEPNGTVVNRVSGIEYEDRLESWTAVIRKRSHLAPVEQSDGSEPRRVAATLEAAGLHRLLKRPGGDKPVIAYLCPSPYLGHAERQLLYHATLAQAFQFEPLLVIPSRANTAAGEVRARANTLGIATTSLPLTVEAEMDSARRLDESEIAEMQKWLRVNRIALVHSAMPMREAGESAHRLQIPHVASLYRIDQVHSQQPANAHYCDLIHSDSFLFANRWAELLNVPARRIMSYVPDQFFEAGAATNCAERLIERGCATVGLFDTLQPDGSLCVP